MPIRADLHVHSSFSGDCQTPMEDMILSAIDKKIERICFTEHMDMDYVDEHQNPSDKFELTTDSYLYDLIRMREKYASKIDVLFGVELGLQKQILRQNVVYAKSYDFDFIIGSIHLANKKDPYFPSYFEGRSVQEAMNEYFAATYENIKSYSNFDSLGHLDYAIRYAPAGKQAYTYEEYADYLDPILELLIRQDKALEINTAGLRKGLCETNPSANVLKRYKQLGGSLITIGSDAHFAADIAASFEDISAMLQQCGFKHYCVYSARIPVEYPL